MMGAGLAGAQEVDTGVRAAVSTLFDDNLLRGNDLRRIAGKSDVRTTPTLDINVSRARGRYRVFLRGDAGYDFHRTNTQLNAERIGLSAGARLAVGGFCGIGVTTRIDRRQVDVGDLGTAERNRLKGETLEVEGSCPRTAGLYPVVSASYRKLDNSSLRRQAFDLQAYSVTAALAYRRPSIGTISLFYSHALFDRPQWSMFGLTNDNRTRVQEAGLRWERAVAARLHGSLSVSAVATNPPTPGVRDFRGVGWRATLSWLPSPATTLTAETNREVRADSSFGAAYLVFDAASITATRRIGHRTTLEGQAALVKRDLRGETDVLGLPLRGSDRTTNLSLGLSYDLGRRTRLSTEIAHSDRDAANPLYDFGSTRIGLRAGYRF